MSDAQKLTDPIDIRSASKGNVAGDLVDVARWVSGWSEAQP